MYIQLYTPSTCVYGVICKNQHVHTHGCLVCTYAHHCTNGFVFCVVSVNLWKDSPPQDLGKSKCWWEGGKSKDSKWRVECPTKCSFRQKENSCTCCLWIPPHRPNMLHFYSCSCAVNKDLGMQERTYGLQCTAAMGMRNPERFPKMYVSLAVYWTISRVAQGRNSSYTIWFCLHFIKKQFTFSNGSCLKDLLFSLVSSSINGSFLLFLNLTTSGSSFVRQLRAVRNVRGGSRRSAPDTGITQGSISTHWFQTPHSSPAFGALLLFVFFFYISHIRALWHRQCFLSGGGWKSPFFSLKWVFRSNICKITLNTWHIVCLQRHLFCIWIMGGNIHYYLEPHRIKPFL